MNSRLSRFFRIKNSFLIVFILIQLLLLSLALLLARLTLQNIEQNEAEKRDEVSKFVQGAFAHGTSSTTSAVAAVVANEQYMQLFAAGDRPALLSATSPLFDQLRSHDGIKQMQFTSQDFKVFLRLHNPSLFGDDVTTSRPTLVECITSRHSVAGLEQGRSGYGFRSVTPAYFQNAFRGCAELGLDLNVQFLETLNANYPGQWAVVNLVKGTSFTTDRAVLATLNQPLQSALLRADYSTPENIVSTLFKSQPYYRYLRSVEQVELYIPIRNFKGEVALYVLYSAPTPYYAVVRRMLLHTFTITLLGLLLTGLAFSLLYRGIRTPVHELVLETEKIKNFDLSEKVEIKASLVELETLIQAVGDMKAGLQSFQKYVPANLVRQLIDTHQEARIGGKLKELTVFFSDIADFTSITENLSPNDLTKQLSEYFNCVTEIILAHQGTVDKFIGDAVMAFWGAPIELEDHALLACQAALRCRREIDKLSATWKQQGRYAFHTRIGLSTGEIIVGNIGSDQRLNYSVIGDTVNLASRLEGLNKEYKTSIILNEATYQSCRGQIEARLIDFVTVKGKLEPVRIYELIGEKGDISPRQKESLKLFSRAIEAYMGLEFAHALELMRELQRREPDDAVAALYVERCERFMESPPEPGWRGYTRYVTK